ncbi:DNA-processing protein DprA [Jannaschia pohangensis]|uniref:DNA processing protein n=1 Tax=Jannaschia pohangensis TaxID=390807 RepID=A0A1I3QH70_9RHOB|nr:DNA-processing protein DprA [Jannaschia pohangensis]SFJ32862.1 DNA processing protein [Jannaschia pohangensis]
MDYVSPDSGPEFHTTFDEAPLPAFDPAPSQDELFARLRLIRSRRVGSATWRRLLAEHGNAVAALEALPGVAAAAGDTGYRPADEASIRREVQAARRLGARMLAFGTPGYPAELAKTRDPSPILWAQGRIELLTRTTVAIVGTRNASSLALRMARALGRDLAQAGIVVASGLARGVDAVAHDAALPGGTIAVHAGGLDRIYPAENIDLAAKIAVDGLSISERPFGLAPQARDFPRRNRIVAGLSQAVVVVEAAAKSGSMITARDALDEGREVLAVPGHPFDGRAGGCNLLLRDGATLVRGVQDILDVLDLMARSPEAPEPRPEPVAAPQVDATTTPDTSQLRDRILSLLSPTPVTQDDLARDIAASGPVSANQLALHLSELELEGSIARQPGGGLIRA